MSEKASMRHRCPINLVRVRVCETQIECETRRHPSILDSSESLQNAALERGALFTIGSLVLSDETSPKGGSDDANWFRSIPRFPVGWRRPGGRTDRRRDGGVVTWPEKLPGFATARRLSTCAPIQLLNCCCGCETNGGIIVLLFLASRTRALVTREYMEFSALLPR